MDKKKTFSTQAVKDFLNKTGFPFEWKMERLLRQKNWMIGNKFYLDLDENKKREVDIIAAKTINEIDIFLTIECKYSKKDSWIFFSPNKRIHRYYGYFICSPLPDIDSKKIITSHLRIFNRAEPTAVSFKTYDNYKEKQSNDSEITDALYKVVKALIYCYSHFSTPSKRQVYFPVILFSGPIFCASYSDRLRVKKTNYIQFPFEFESEAYISKKEVAEDSLLDEGGIGFSGSLLSSDYDEETKIREIEGIKKAYKGLFNKHLIEFVSGYKFGAYLDQLETEIGSIDTNLWPVKSEKS